MAGYDPDKDKKLKEWKNKGMQIIAYNTDLGFLGSGAGIGIKELA